MRYPGRRDWALRDVDLVIEPGERVLLAGASGSGKSTLLAALAGLLDPSGGAVLEGNLTVDGTAARSARDRIAIVFQDPSAQIVMGRAGDDVAFGLENRCVPPAEIWPRVASALDAVGFPYQLDRPTHALSGGEQQRLALAGALALQPGLLLLDEPTANLDPQGAADFGETLRRATRTAGPTTVLVEHRVDDALPSVERVVVLDAGRVVADGSPDHVFAGRGPALADAGVWVPGPPPVAPPRAPLGVGETLVAAQHVAFRYPAADADAIHDVTVDVNAGETLALVGPNGSGKSTLALLLAGLLGPRDGSVVAGRGLGGDLAGQPIHRWSAARLARRIGMVFQNPEHQLLAPSVRDELRLGPIRTGLSAAEADRRADDLMERLRLSHLAAANPFTLSGGEKRRLSVATALAAAPELLVLDEPTFGQDRRTWAELVALLATLRSEGRGLCIATHDRLLVDALADRVMRLDPD